MGSVRRRVDIQAFANDWNTMLSKAVLQLLGYPSGAARELHAGTLNLTHCTTPVASGLSTWLLPADDLLCDSGFCGTPSGGAKRRRLTKKSKEGV